MTGPNIASYPAEENRTLSVSTCRASSWLVTVNRDGTCTGDPGRGSKWTSRTGLSARIPANIGYGSRISPASSANCRIGS